MSTRRTGSPYIRKRGRKDLCDLMSFHSVVVLLLPLCRLRTIHATTTNAVVWPWYESSLPPSLFQNCTEDLPTYTHKHYLVDNVSTKVQIPDQSRFRPCKGCVVYIIFPLFPNPSDCNCPPFFFLFTFQSMFLHVQVLYHQDTKRSNERCYQQGRKTWIVRFGLI